MHEAFNFVYNGNCNNSNFNEIVVCMCLVKFSPKFSGTLLMICILGNQLVNTPSYRAAHFVFSDSAHSPNVFIHTNRADQRKPKKQQNSTQTSQRDPIQKLLMNCHPDDLSCISRVLCHTCF